MTTEFKVVIPARYDSTRLPGKPLIFLAGKPMIAHVCERAKESGAEQVIVATDDQRIFDVVENLGFEVVITSKTHASGTERIAEVAKFYNWKSDDIVVNLQGDEPLLPGQYIQEVAKALSIRPATNVSTLASEIDDVEELFDSNIVKVVLNKNSCAMYFSRAAIPWNRNTFNAKKKYLGESVGYFRHVGLYAYTVDFLNRYIAWQKSGLEDIEVLEQLRILWHGEAITVHVVSDVPPAGVDTKADVVRVEQLLLDRRRK